MQLQPDLQADEEAHCQRVDDKRHGLAPPNRPGTSPRSTESQENDTTQQLDEHVADIPVQHVIHRLLLLETQVSRSDH